MPDTKKNYSRIETLKMGFPCADYTFPDTEGEFTGTLMHKKETKSINIICYFDTDYGEKYKLCAWAKKKRMQRSYRPRKSKIDLTDVATGTRMTVTYNITEKGYNDWLTAEFAEDND